MKLRIFFLICGLALSASGQIDLKEIMKGYDFIGYSPENIAWNLEGDGVYFTKKYDENGSFSTFFLDIKTKRIDTVTKPYWSFSDAYLQHSKGYYLTNGYTLVNFDGKKVDTVFTSSKYLRLLDVQGQALFFLWGSDQVICYDGNSFRTQVKLVSKQRAHPKSSQEVWLEEQQNMLFKDRSPVKNAVTDMEVVKLEVDKRTTQVMGYSARLNQVYLKKGEDGGEPTFIMNYLDASGFSTEVRARKKVGHFESGEELLTFSVGTQKLETVGLASLEGSMKRPAYRQDYDPLYLELLDVPKKMMVHGPFISKQGKVVFSAKSIDNKDRWIFSIEGNSTKLIDHQHDEAWIGGPGITGWNMYAGTLFFTDGEELIFQSEETGYSHVYAYDFTTSERRALTAGEFEVMEVTYRSGDDKLYCITNKNGTQFHHPASISIETGGLELFSEKEGGFEIYPSPTKVNVVYRYSSMNQPWEIAGIQKGEVLLYTQSQNESYSKGDWIKPSIVRFKAQDGEEVTARQYVPENPNGAAIIFVHGAGYLQNAHAWWSVYYHEYLFHNLLIEKGYTVLDIDYRGSAGYGRDWRTGIYRHMGGKDLSDHLDGKKYLVENLGIDADRVGIYGGSYGGFISISAMLKAPEEFACAAALRSVTDWAHYNHPYTSNILNTPELDSEAYQRSSPINFAENLQGPLLMLHGLMDDNVQVQDVYRLSQRFIELNKTDWWLQVYPIEPHSFKYADSWFDEYRRILELMDTYLK